MINKDKKPNCVGEKRDRQEREGKKAKSPVTTKRRTDEEEDTERETKITERGEGKLEEEHRINDEALYVKSDKNRSR